MGKNRMSGFSLIEVMVVMGLMSIAGLAMMEMSTFGVRSMRNITQLSDFNSLVSLVRMVTQSPTLCENNLKSLPAFTAADVTANQTGNNNPINIGALYLYDQAGTQTGVLAQFGGTNTYGKLDTLSLQLYPKGFVGSGTGTVLAFLHIQVNKKDSTAMKAYGNKTLDASDIPININVTNSSGQNQISGCASSTVGTSTTLLVRHSFSSTAPTCPTGWNLVRGGFTVYDLGATNTSTRISYLPGDRFYPDLGSTGSCIARLDATSGQTDLGGSTTSVPNQTFANINTFYGNTYAPITSAWKCAVCEKASPVLLEHSWFKTVPAACPTGWTELWRGNTNLGAHMYNNQSFAYLTVRAGQTGEGTSPCPNSGYPCQGASPYGQTSTTGLSVFQVPSSGGHDLGGTGSCPGPNPGDFQGGGARPYVFLQSDCVVCGH